MRRGGGIGLCLGAGVLVVAAGLMLVVAPGQAPAGVALALVTTTWPLVRAWRAAKGTALRSAVVWGAVAIGLGLAAQAAAWGEPIEDGRPAAGHWAYLSGLATLAALLSVLNARRPGSGAWAILMALLVLVFLIPWLEGSGIAGQGGSWSRLRLESPWTLFYGLLVMVGISNYLPTRFGPASLWLGLGLVLEYAALTQQGWPLPRRALVWSVAPWTIAAALWTAEACALRPAGGRQGLERLWFWYRDHWGTVWALRMQERFNRSAEILGWPVRLTWFGVVSAPGSTPPGENDPPRVPDEAEAAFRGLLRRFAEPCCLEAAMGRAASDPCQPHGLP